MGEAAIIYLISILWVCTKIGHSQILWNTVLNFRDPKVPGTTTDVNINLGDQHFDKQNAVGRSPTADHTQLAA